MRSVSLPLTLAALLATVSGCVAPMDDPTLVHDFRVLGVALEPPELMAPSCSTTGIDPASLLSLARPIPLHALIVDPAGAGRAVHWELFACSDIADRTCSNDRVALGSGDVTPPSGSSTIELTVPNLQLALLRLPDDTFLLQSVLAKDTYGGLGGIRLPLVLHVSAGDESVWAQKLMVFSCKLFPDQAQNVTPVLPGMTVEGADWPESTVATLSGPGPFQMSPLDYSALQEPYVVAGLASTGGTTPANLDISNLNLEPVHLVESWRTSWYTDLGGMSPTTSGGTDLAGDQVGTGGTWNPPENGSEQDVHFWFVVRDGRGGQSWLTRTAHWVP